MIDIPNVVIILIIAFFTFIGVAMIILGIYLYRRQPGQKSTDYVTQIKAPTADNPHAGSDQPADWLYSKKPEGEGAVHRGSGGMVPTEVGRLLDNIVPPQLSRNPLSPKNEPILPADVSRKLESEMLNGRNHLEDVNYGKIVPNNFIVEVSPENYDQNYEPIEAQACEQWQKRLLNSLNTANGRQGRKVYRFGGPVKVHVRPTTDLSNKEVRIHSQIKSEKVGEFQIQAAYLERIPDGKRWQLKEGITTLGRSASSNIYLDSPVIQEKRLISNQHAYISAKRGHFYLFDGSPNGKPSQNNTFANGYPVTESGHKLSDGDVIILAALDYNNPRPDLTGAVGFIFHAE